jgi:rhodanese-related sulfurtransferase
MTTKQERNGVSGGSPVKVVLLEALVVAIAGIAVAFVANALSPRGLNLTRDYFPNDRQPLAVVPINSAPAPGATNTASPFEQLAAKFHAEGLQLADNNLATKLFHDPKYQQGLVIFVDARKDEAYQAGHIPGAYQLDHFHPEEYIATTVPVCQTAEQIIVYCNGGECDDSENTAIFLRDAGIPKEKLFVYAGGIEEWTASHLPLETGTRNSGNIKK